MPIQNKYLKRKINGWSQDDQLYALKEGWGIFNLGNTNKPQLEIQRHDVFNIFSSDHAALHYVLKKSAISSLHRKAIKEVYEI